MLFVFARSNGGDVGKAKHGVSIRFEIIKAVHEPQLVRETQRLPFKIGLLG
jgi:hypothetical protein